MPAGATWWTLQDGQTILTTTGADTLNNLNPASADIAAYEFEIRPGMCDTWAGLKPCWTMPHGGLGSAFNEQIIHDLGGYAALSALDLAGGSAGTEGSATIAEKPLWGSWSDYERISVGGRDYAVIDGRLYTRHAVYRMLPVGYGGRGVSPAFVEDVIANPESVEDVLGPSGQARISYASGSVQVITENGIVVTVITR